MASEESKYPDNVLLQLIESVYRPAENWESCTLPMTTDQIVKKLMEHFPGKFEDSDQITRLLEALHVQHAYNEHNGKWYWLLKMK